MKSRADSVASQSKREYEIKLNYFYDIAQSTIAYKQDPVTGLLPCGESVDQAWVRDNVYAGTALWGLSLAYRKLLDVSDSKSKCYELQKAVVKLMRGLLQCMINQREKVEKFKASMSVSDALHAKYSSRTTDTVVGDNDYGHLQLDATSLYLLMLAQMISSGVYIIFTLDEVAFVQNLVFYIQNAYMTPDFGIWERGDKTNHGVPELNTSSVGMAKAALEAMDELNLFGAEGGPQSVIHVSPDFIVWCNDVIQAVLPRESTSKESDAALLSVITFPAFAVDSMEIVEKTKAVILGKLEGNYGLRRFLRDGYKCPREDRSRLYYDPSELKLFENLECEWPIFWTYLIIDGVFRGNTQQVDSFSERLEGVLLQDKSGTPLVPQLYEVPANRIEQELESPGSQSRIAGGQIPFTWGQSMYILAMLLRENLVAPGELDPLNRRLQTDPKPDTIVQATILTDSDALQSQLARLSIPIFTVRECNPISVLPAESLKDVMGSLGSNARLGLSGNPAYELGILATSMLYTWQNRIFAFIPELFKEQNFYTYTDCEYLIDCFKVHLSIVEKNWAHKSGRPTVIFFLTASQLDADRRLNRAFISACRRISSGYFGGIRLNYGRLNEFLSTSCMSSLDFLSTTCDLSLSTSKYSGSGGMARICQTGGRLRDNTYSKTSETDIYQASSVLKMKKAKKLTEIRSAVRHSRMMFQPGVPSTVLPEFEPVPDIAVASSPDSPGLAKTKETSLSRPRHLGAKHKNVDDAISLLSTTDDAAEQADLLYYLYISSGLGCQFKYRGQDCILADLIMEMYDKAVVERSWWLIRFCAGMLDYHPQSLSNALTSILIHYKEVSIGYPEAPFKEVVFNKPVPLDRLMSDVKRACRNDIMMAVLTQEMLLSISSIISTDPNVFKEIIRIRIGLLVQILLVELRRINACSEDDAHSKLYNLSPFEVKSMLMSLLTGRELDVQARSTESRRLKGTIEGTLQLKPSKWLGSHARSIAALELEDESEKDLVDEDKYGQWLRRRRIDGSLNRVPVGFYEKIWQALDKCYGFTIAHTHLSNSLTREMTREELKFAMAIEKAINTIPIPEYRQLIVEATLMTCLILLSNSKFFYSNTIDMDDVVSRASNLYQNDAVASGIPEKELHQEDPAQSYEQANRIVSKFFDCAPSGRYGTMSYMLRALFQLFNVGPEFEWTIDMVKY